MKKIKTIYLHGLNGYPLPQKVEMLEKAGFSVYAPQLDYRIEPHLYNRIRTEIVEQEIKFLVGSSLGGYLAYWLAEDLRLPCLLFNPAMSYSDQLSDYIPEIEIGNCPARFVVIGRWDDVVDPEENIRFFRDVEDDNCYQRVIVCEWLSHEIDFESFEELAAWASVCYKVYEKNDQKDLPC
jgi:uncharacterized protein